MKTRYIWACLFRSANSQTAVEYMIASDANDAIAGALAAEAAKQKFKQQAVENGWYLLTPQDLESRTMPNGVTVATAFLYAGERMAMEFFDPVTS